LITAIIPARGGSKGVPGKNLRQVGGRSLVARAVEACLRTRTIESVYVSTDDNQIASAAEVAGARVILRPAELADDLASSESVLLHALDHLVEQPDVVVFVQCTSPFISSDDLDRGAELVASRAADSVFSAVPTYEFLWRSSRDGLVSGQNHDAARRPRRQDREPDHRETGAFYVLDAAGFRAAQHRFFGRTAVVEVGELTAVEIDHEDDLVLAQALAPTLDQPSAVDVDVLITDFDGVHTDDGAYVDQSGRESVRVSRSDGLGIERLRQAGVAVLIVSKETNPVVRVRAAKLGVEVLHGVEHKAEVVRDWLAAKGIPASRASYLGNDLNDLGPMSQVAWPVAVADAQPAVRSAARLVLSRAGGHGAVRELCELILLRRAAPKPATHRVEGGSTPAAVAERDGARVSAGSR
jgi:N-acylneuraminate cytidylyltransferase